MADVTVSNQGSVIGFTPMTEAATDWIESNVHSESYQWMGPTLWVEHRFANDLIDGMSADGLEVA